MSYNLFLDDIRYPYVDPKLKHLYVQNGRDYFDMVSAYNYTGFEKFKTEQWLIVRDYDEFVKIIEKKGVPKFVAFDHDLGDEHYNSKVDYEEYTEKTGYECAKWLCDYCQDNNVKFPGYYIHSMNVVGKINIKHYIENYIKYVENE